MALFRDLLMNSGMTFSLLVSLLVVLFSCHHKKLMVLGVVGADCPQSIPPHYIESTEFFLIVTCRLFFPGFFLKKKKKNKTNHDEKFCSFGTLMLCLCVGE